MAFKSYRLTDIPIDRQIIVTRGHFRSRDRNGGHAIGSAISENSMIHANLMALLVIEPELWAIEGYNAGKCIWGLLCSCDLDLDPMTFIYELDPFSLEIFRMCKYELSM